MAYIPKSKRNRTQSQEPIVGSVLNAQKLRQKQSTIMGMLDQLDRDALRNKAPNIMYELIRISFEATKPFLLRDTDRMNFVHDFGAKLNQWGLLPDENVKQFREYGYEYMR